MPSSDIQADIIAVEKELCHALTVGGDTRSIRERLAILHTAKAFADTEAAAIQAEARAKAEQARLARIAKTADRHATDAASRIATRMAALAAPPALPFLR